MFFCKLGFTHFLRSSYTFEQVTVPPGTLCKISHQGVEFKIGLKFTLFSNFPLWPAMCTFPKPVYQLFHLSWACFCMLKLEKHKQQQALVSKMYIWSITYRLLIKRVFLPQQPTFLSASRAHCTVVTILKEGVQIMSIKF